jgi:hypothetical protein
MIRNPFTVFLTTGDIRIQTELRVPASEIFEFGLQER